MYRKEICYDRETKDYRASYEGNTIGWYNSYLEAECALDHYVSDLARQTQADTADMEALAAEGKSDPLPGVCRNCYQPHPTYRCPEIRALLFAPVVERVLGRAA